MVVHGAAGVPLGHQLLPHLIHLCAVLEVKGEVGAGRRVAGTQQGDALTGLGPLQVAPVVGLPGEAQAQGFVEALGPRHVLHPQGHMAEAMNGSGRRHGEDNH